MTAPTFQDAIERAAVWLPDGRAGELVWVARNRRTAKVRVFQGDGSAAWVRIALDKLEVVSP